MFNRIMLLDQDGNFVAFVKIEPQDHIPKIIIYNTTNYAFLAPKTKERPIIYQQQPYVFARTCYAEV